MIQKILATLRKSFKKREKKFVTYEDLPKKVQDILFQNHTHADLVDDNEIVYTEESVIHIINLLMK